LGALISLAPNIPLIKLLKTSKFHAQCSAKGGAPYADDSTLGNNSINVREQPPLLALPLPLRRRRLGVGKSGMSYSFAFKLEDGLIGFGGVTACSKRRIFNIYDNSVCISWNSWIRWAMTTILTPRLRTCFHPQNGHPVRLDT
jgi:hypothetical protein